ncbi:MAG: DUF4843 domain-containing protein [Odoribacter sp.]
MKNIKYICLLFFLGSIAGCQKSDIMLYEQRAGVYFSTYSYAYSFTDNPGVDTTVLRLPVDITGLPMDYDREFIITLPAVDTITTAEDDQYKIGKGIVKAGEGKGFVELELYRDDRLKDSTYRLLLSIQRSPDFPEIRLNRFSMSVSFTERLIRPINWQYLSLGDYSTAWWRFILEVTEGNTLRHWTGGPGGATNPDPEYWYMTYAELGAWRTVIRIALDDYNANHSEPLKHDDGEKKGEQVKMPN